MVKIKYNKSTGEIERPAFDSESFPDLDGDFIEVENEVWATEQGYKSLKVNVKTLALEHGPDVGHVLLGDAAEKRMGLQEFYADQLAGPPLRFWYH